MTGPAHLVQLARMRALRALQVDRATAALAAAGATLNRAEADLRLAQVALRATVAQRGRAHRQLYNEMLANGIGATGLEIAEAAMADRDAGIERARGDVEAARRACDAAREARDAARIALARRHRDLTVWDKLQDDGLADARRTARRAEHAAQDAIADLAAVHRS